VIVFCSVRFSFYKKITKLKNRNRVKQTGFGSVRFGFLGEKPVQTGLTWIFRFGSVFSSFGSVFSVWLSLISVRFFAYKTKTNRPVFSKF